MYRNVGVQRLEANASTIRSLTIGLTPEQARWKPDANSWSVIEVIAHLLDEEREDFRVRLDLILHHPEREWPPIDPEGWAASRRYLDRQLQPTIEAFLEERRASIEWLKGLGAIDWQAAVEAPFARIAAGDMFAAWVAHDLLHIRQLVRIHWAVTSKAMAPHRTLYAGEW